MKFWIYVTQDSFGSNCSGSLFSQILGESVIPKIYAPSSLVNMELKIFENKEPPWESKFTKVLWKALIPLSRAWQVALSFYFRRRSRRCIALRRPAVRWACQPTAGPESWPAASTRGSPHSLFKRCYCSCSSYWEIASVVTGAAHLICMLRVLTTCKSVSFHQLNSLSPRHKVITRRNAWLVRWRAYVLTLYQHF